MDESPQGPKDDVELSGYFQIATEILQNDDGKTQTEKESVARDQKAEKWTNMEDLKVRTRI